MMEEEWGIMFNYGFEAVRIIKRTEKMVFYIDARWGNPRETRRDKSAFLDWSGDEVTTRKIEAKLTSVKVEKERRMKAVNDWFAARKAEIFAEHSEPSQ